MNKKALTLILALSTVVSMTPFPAFAESETEYIFTYAELNGDDIINARSS
jgi:hypothetical protein